MSLLLHPLSDILSSPPAFNISSVASVCDHWSKAAKQQRRLLVMVDINTMKVALKAAAMEVMTALKKEDSVCCGATMATMATQL